jgi:hypothetical protein
MRVAGRHRWQPQEEEFWRTLRVAAANTQPTGLVFRFWLDQIFIDRSLEKACPTKTSPRRWGS